MSERSITVVVYKEIIEAEAKRGSARAKEVLEKVNDLNEESIIFLKTNQKSTEIPLGIPKTNEVDSVKVGGAHFPICVRDQLEALRDAGYKSVEYNLELCLLVT